jgi:hypothetical protein
MSAVCPADGSQPAPTRITITPSKTFIFVDPVDILPNGTMQGPSSKLLITGTPGYILFIVPNMGFG